MDIDDYFLIQFLINATICSVGIRTVTSHISNVREELVMIREEGLARQNARHVLDFYVKLGNVVLIVNVHLVFISAFIIVLNACYVYVPQYSWPFFAVSVISYSALGLVPVVFWYSGGKTADEFVEDYESTLATGATISIRIHPSTVVIPPVAPIISSVRMQEQEVI
jgi:hypothetical protein